LPAHLVQENNPKVTFSSPRLNVGKLFFGLSPSSVFHQVKATLLCPNNYIQMSSDRNIADHKLSSLSACSQRCFSRGWVRFCVFVLKKCLLFVCVHGDLVCWCVCLEMLVLEWLSFIKYIENIPVETCWRFVGNYCTRTVCFLCWQIQAFFLVLGTGVINFG